MAEAIAGIERKKGVKKFCKWIDTETGQRNCTKPGARKGGLCTTHGAYMCASPGTFKKQVQPFGKWLRCLRHGG